MALIKWQSVCTKCGKSGSTTSRSENLGSPSSTPPAIGGKCPSSSDGKHKPKWVKL